MRAEMKHVPPPILLDRVLEALEQELIDASDEEILAAARELRLNPEMKGSAIFLGLKYAAKARLSDFFDVAASQNAQVGHDARTRLAGAKRKARKKPL